jgi:hypothetical protein
VVVEEDGGDATSLFRFTRGRARRGSRRVRIPLRLQLKGPVDLPRPVSLVLAGLPSGTRLVGASGFTRAPAPRGSPYLNLNPGVANQLAGGQGEEVVLTFRQRTPGPVRFTPRVLVGFAPR